jgi:hypothetical protein
MPNTELADANAAVQAARSMLDRLADEVKNAAHGAGGSVDENEVDELIRNVAEVIRSSWRAVDHLSGYGPSDAGLKEDLDDLAQANNLAVQVALRHSVGGS